MIKFITTVAILLFMATSLHADKAEDLRVMMAGKAKEIESILKDSTLSKAQKNDLMSKTTDYLFDYYLMARLSLSKKWWNKFSAQQRKEYSKELERRLKKAYMDKLHLYTDEKVVVDKAKQTKKNRIQVLATIQTKNDFTDMIYKFYSAKDGEWMIYDVEVAGVSIIQTYRAQFAELLETNTIVEFLDKLRLDKN